MLTHTRLIGSINIKRKRHIMAQHNLVCRGAAVAAAVGSAEVLPAGTPWESGNSVCVRLKVREDEASAPAQSPPPSLMIRPAAEDIFSSVSS